MPDTKWVVDRNDVVHAGYCNVKGDYCIPYVATKLVKGTDGRFVQSPVTDYREMAIHLSGSDIRDNHRGTPLVKPCRVCVPAAE